MRKRTIARISIASGTALLCLAMAGPAVACVVPSDFENAGFSQTADSVAGAIAKADHQISGQLGWLAHDAKKVSTDPNLTSAQQAQFTADVAAATAALQAVKVQVDAATTTAAVNADLASTAVKSAETVVGLDLAITGGNDYIAGEQNGLTRQAARTAAETDLTSGQKADLATMFTTAQATLAAARTSVDAATTAAAIRAIEKSTHAPLDAINLKIAIDRADDEIAAAQAKLATWLTQVQSATDLTSAQQTAAEAKIAAAQAALTALQAKVDAATSSGQVAALLRSAHFGDQPWNGDDPAKLPRMTPAQLTALKRTVPTHPVVVPTQNRPATLVVQKSQTHSDTSGGRGGGSSNFGGHGGSGHGSNGHGPHR